MKLHYYLMSMALAATALVGFTACNDDDETFEPVYVVGGDQGEGSVGFSEADIRVKIGEDNRVAVPVEGSLAGVRAYSLDPEVAIVVDVDGVPMIEGLKNGNCRVMVSDANGNYETLLVSVYTTDEMTLNYSNVVATGFVGNTIAVSGVEVALGNGTYSATCEDPRVTPYIDAESGQLAVNCVVEEEDYTAVVTVTDISLLTANLTVAVSPASHRVKIGEDTREALPFSGDYTAEVSPASNATLYTDASGKQYIEGKANGSAVVKAGVGDTLYFLTYSVYTTDVMTLSATSIEMTTMLGISGRNTDVKVDLGNGGYSIASNNPSVTASISASTGAITINATSRVKDYTATLTVTDCTGLTATLNVTVKASMEPFTADEIESIKNSGPVVFGQCKDPSDGTTPYYYRWVQYGYGEYINETVGDTKTIGWWMNQWGSDYGGIKIDYPASAEVNEEVTGKFYYQYSNRDWYDLYTYDGKAKVLVDDASKIAVIFWQIDLANERINRGYVVVNK